MTKMKETDDKANEIIDTNYDKKRGKVNRVKG